jgi:antitoxin ParD1/3/4
MNVVLNPELEQLIQSQLDTGKYENVESVLREALRLLYEQNTRRIIARKVKDLFDKTQAIPEVQAITEEEIAVEIEAYRRVAVGCVAIDNPQ